MHLRDQSRKILSPERNRARSVVVESSVSDTGGRRFEPRSAQTSDFFLDRPVHIPIYRCICEIKAEKILSPERNRARSVVVESSVSDTGGRRFEPRSAQTSDFFLDRPVHIPIYRCICEIKAEKILSPERNRARSVVVDSSVSDTGGRREPRSNLVHIPIYRSDQSRKNVGLFLSTARFTPPGYPYIGAFARSKPKKF